MTVLSVSIRTLDGRRYEGNLVAGEFMVGDAKIPASRLSHLELPHHSISGSVDPGELRLCDGATFTIRGATRGWLSKSIDYDITGGITVHVDSLGKDIAVQVGNMKYVTVALSETPEIQLALQAKLLDTLESWLKQDLLDSFSGDCVRFVYGWTLEAKLSYGSSSSELSVRKLALRRAAMSFAAEFGSTYSLRPAEATIDDYGKLCIRLSRM